MSERRGPHLRRRQLLLRGCLTPAPRSVRALRGPRALLAALLGVLAVALPSVAPAQVDQPISAKVLKVKEMSGGAQVIFVSTDPAVPFPAVGTDDDPATGSPGGMIIDVFSSTQGLASASAPAGLANPGWKVSTSGADAYHYRTPLAGLFAIRNATLVEGKRLRVRAQLNFAIAAPLGTVAVRVRTGSLRSCALFEGASVVRDDTRFVGKNAPAPALADCADDTLLAAISPGCSTSGAPVCDATCPDGGICAPDAFGSSCRCVYPTQPCGTTAPVCGGACGPGEQCYPIDDFIPGSINACACAPIGAPPCGTSGQTCDTGGCPDGLECTGIPPITPTYEAACGCVDPTATCGPGFGTCPPDLECIFFPPGGGGSYSCLPTFCGATYPTCGGTCGDGRSCVPLEVQGSGFCVCATPSLSCEDLACGEGLFCPSGEVCRVAGGPPTCSCEPP
jgi:hypothetical protein